MLKICYLAAVFAGHKLLSLGMFGDHMIVKSSFPKELLAAGLTHKQLSCQTKL